MKFTLSILAVLVFAQALFASTLLRRMIGAGSREALVAVKKNTYRLEFVEQGCRRQLKQADFPNYCFEGLGYTEDQGIWTHINLGKLNNICRIWSQKNSNTASVDQLNKYLELANLSLSCRKDLQKIKKIQLYKSHSHTFVDME